MRGTCLGDEPSPPVRGQRLGDDGRDKDEPQRVDRLLPAEGVGEKVNGEHTDDLASGLTA